MTFAKNNKFKLATFPDLQDNPLPAHVFTYLRVLIGFFRCDLLACVTMVRF